MSEQLFLAICDRLSSIEHHLQGLVNNNSNTFHEDIIDINEAAKILHLSKSSVYKMTGKKILPHMKTGKILLFSRKDITAYITQNGIKTIQQEIRENENRLKARN